MTPEERNLSARRWLARALLIIGSALVSIVLIAVAILQFVGG